jgi:hypothetical protein
MFLKQTSEYVAGEFPTGKLTRHSPEALTQCLIQLIGDVRQPIRPGTPRIELGRLWAMSNQLPRRFPPPRERAKVQRPPSRGRQAQAGRRAGGSNCSHGRAGDHRLTVKGERPRLQLGRGCSDGGIAVVTVITAAGEQAHRGAGAVKPEPVSSLKRLSASATAPGSTESNRCLVSPVWSITIALPS